MSASAVATLLRRAGEWLVEPVDAADRVLPGPVAQPAPGRALAALPPRSHPVVGVVGLARRCGATTLARALGAVLAERADGAAVVCSPARPAVVALGSSPAASRLAQSLPQLDHTRAAGRLCLAACDEPQLVAAATRHLAPAIVEVDAGSAAVDAARTVDRIVLVASPAIEPALAAAVAETIGAVAPAPVIAVNRAAGHGPWLVRADVLVPDSRLGARMALAGREPGGWLGRSVGQLADLCAAD